MNGQNKTMAAIVWGVVASLFLSSTFIINSVISGSGGHWAWTASLRSLFLIPILALVLSARKQLAATWATIRQYPLLFIKWGIIGFGVLYTTLALASLWSPGWMVAASFQVNILAGILLAPFIYPDHRKAIPKRALILNLLILAGVFIIQIEKIAQLHSGSGVLISFLLVIVGAIVWPLGNRKLMVDLEHHGISLNALQRVWGMTIGCVPLLLILSIIGYAQSGLPTMAQSSASFWSAIFSGFLGGVGFYQATQLVSKNTVALAAIEATQVLEILFTFIGEMVLRGAAMPGIYAQIGFGVILTGLLIQFGMMWRQGKERSQLTDNQFIKPTTKSTKAFTKGTKLL